MGNAQLSQGQALGIYKRYLSEIASFLTRYPRSNNKFRNDMKSVLGMSQDDSMLTPREKQEIVGKFASDYEFLLPEKQVK